MRRQASIAIAIAVATTAALAGCGYNVSSPDLFVLKRTGQGKTLTLLVNDDGTIHCNGGAAKTLSDPMLLQARDVATSLDKDVKAKLSTRTSANSVYTYTVQLQDGTISFADTAGAAHPELARAELFAVQVAQRPCGLA
jgi:hypothetical protein